VKRLPKKILNNHDEFKRGLLLSIFFAKGAICILVHFEYTQGVRKLLCPGKTTKIYAKLL
jgi:hypothetical protein